MMKKKSVVLFFVSTGDDMHAKIAEKIGLKGISGEITILGGARIDIDHDKKTLNIRNDSGSYGSCSNQIVEWMLQEYKDKGYIITIGMSHQSEFFTKEQNKKCMQSIFYIVENISMKKIFDPVTNHFFAVDKNSISHGNRAVDFSKIHGVTQKDLNTLIGCLTLAPSDKVLDIGCGYGDASIAAIKTQADIQLYPLDVSELQLNRMKRNMSAQITEKKEELYVSMTEIHYTKGSGTNLYQFQSGSIDKIIQKMSLHEITKNEQEKSLRESYRVLKKGGKMVVRDIFLQNQTLQTLFQRTARKKDELAGFVVQAQKRYFFREDEFKAMVSNVGFPYLEEVGEVFSRFGTRKRIDQELQGSESLLQERHEYIREIIKEYDEDIKTEINYLDDGDNIEFDILQKKIYLLIK